MGVLVKPNGQHPTPPKESHFSVSGVQAETLAGCRPERIHSTTKRLLGWVILGIRLHKSLRAAKAAIAEVGR